ncbi:hypothetical protein [Undibacterium fentianense]|uniref:Uncharacterized protein n=1 Tax=Undibacterium fentianense TaxID=2828728 RepID=A0A941E5V4_9BURK|nr:hypothetical protein [Undibacterium fentianense]MBR7801712.1 hypothetical protein [Undibacterium fentianense]
MSLLRLFQTLDIFSSKRNRNLAPGLLSTTMTGANTSSFDLTWPAVERRTIADRRLHERRVINCQPYIDTRKNNGRRRSFGRRAGDESTALPF